MEENYEQIASAITHDLADINRCYYFFLLRNLIALYIGQKPIMFRNSSGILVHERFTASPLGFHYYCDLNSMLTFLPNSWLSSDSINGAISGSVAPQQRIQYMSSD